MRNLALATILSTFIASPSTGQTTPDRCQEIGYIAEFIMQQRQNGAAMSAMMSAFGADELQRWMVVAAYERPRMSTPSNQERQIQDFRNDVELICYSQAEG